MPSTTNMNPKDLYLGKCLEDLNRQAAVPEGKKIDSMQLAKSAEKVLSAAEKSEMEKDEEKTYVLYMKYIAVYQNIKKSMQYKSDPKYYELIFGKKNLNKSITTVERLSTKLEDRYNKQKIEAEQEADRKLEEKLKAMTHKERKMSPDPTKDGLSNGTSTPNVKKVTEVSDVITPFRLYSLIKERSTSFMLVDARPSADYNASKVKDVVTVNIPEEILSPGLTAKALERKIHIESRTSFSRRTGVDLLILCDWQSERFVEGTPLFWLKEAMCKWDTTAAYKSRPHVLQGGFENFAIHYPMLTTNPAKARAPAKAKKDNDSNSINLSTIEYPDLDGSLDKGFIQTPSPNRTTPIPSKSGGGGSLYPSTAELSPAISSGAITVVRGPDTAKPSIPDRKTKPTFESFDSDVFNTAKMDSELASARSSIASVASEFNNGMIEDVGDSDGDDGLPKVDRSLKAKALLKIGGAEKKIEDVLEAESDLVDDTIRLEQRKLDLEERWEKLRLIREKEAEEEMKAEMLKKEDQLLEELAKLNEESRAKDEENEKLRKQLQDLKSKLEAENRVRTQQEMQLKRERNAREEILKKDREVQKLKKEVAEKRVLRKERERQSQLRHRPQEPLNPVTSKVRHKPSQEPDDRIVQKARFSTAKLKDEGSSSFGGLNRSYSSPNIAKMVEEEEGAEAPTPRFDRNKKPEKHRDFKPIWATEGKKGLTGLKNLGNTCYMNSILQCISNFTIPSQYFIQKVYERDINRYSATHGQIAIEFTEVLKALWSGHYKSISPSDLKSVIGKYKKDFRGNDQQDAHELLISLMEWLHNDVNEVRNKVTLPEQNNDNIPERQAAENACLMERKVDRSFIRETFYGQRKQTLKCLTCKYESVTFASFFELSLELPPGNGRCNLHQCIDLYLTPVPVTYKCAKCKQDRDMLKKFDIVKFPLILTVQFVRFYNDGLWRKRQNFVDFELTDMDFGKYARGCNGDLNRYRMYNLYGVCNHFGTMEGGHYTAYCYSQVYNKWYKYDDHEVHSMDPSEVKKSSAYILFYSARN